MKNLIIFEDDNYKNFYPITLTRPVQFLRPGIRPLYRVIADSFPGYNTNIYCRENLAGLAGESSDCPVNKKGLSGAETILINSALKPNQNFFAALLNANSDVLIMSTGRLVGAKLFRSLSDAELEKLKSQQFAELQLDLKAGAELMEIEIRLYDYLWDLVNRIEHALEEDFKFLSARSDFKENYIIASGRDISMAYPGVVFINGRNIAIARDAEILPGAVLNGSDGPIVIESGVYIEPHTYLIGPVYVGEKTRLVGGKITGCSIGPVCRAGGEVEESIIQGFTNKYHAGFLGHAYVGEWVNFGAMTTNSDLRNDYKNVKVSINGNVTDTGYLKIGSFIGDFTKTAIGTLLNTGINIGVACNILGNGLVADKEIPSFTWYAAGRMHEYKIAKALETIGKTMSRRDRGLTPELKNCLEMIFEGRK